MVYLKGTLAGIAGSVLALILLVVVIVVMNTLNRPTSGMVGINVVGPIPTWQCWVLSSASIWSSEDDFLKRPTGTGRGGFGVRGA